MSARGVGCAIEKRAGERERERVQGRCDGGAATGSGIMFAMPRRRLIWIETSMGIAASSGNNRKREWHLLSRLGADAQPVFNAIEV
jgi:hypothetical protein